MVSTPRVCATQVNSAPAVMSVTCQTRFGRPGCLILARLPKRTGPLSSRFTVVMDLVHCGQDSTSAITCHTRSWVAEMSMERVSDATKQGYPATPACPVARPGPQHILTLGWTNRPKGGDQIAATRYMF